MKVLTPFILAIGLIFLVNQLIAQVIENRRQSGPLLYEDFIYDENIKTPLIYPTGGVSSNDILQPPVVDLNQGGTMRLEFDWLGKEQPQFRAKIIHCNADWKPSALNDVEFLPDYNEFPIYDVKIAQGTKVGYSHYWLELPKVKVSGNFVVVVYKGRRETDVVFTRRFMAFNQQIIAAGKVSFAQDIPRRNSHQQVDFSLKYGNYPVMNPKQDLYVVLRQNYRWDRTIAGLKPYMVQDRQVKGIGVAKLDFTPNFNAAYLFPDEIQSGKTYMQQNDLDGQFAISTRDDFGDPDYFPVTFTLRSPQREDGKTPYVIGGFNFFELTKNNQMHYEEAAEGYQATILCKQGVYNYMYAVPSADGKRANEEPIEGAYSLTQNTYEIFIYHRAPGTRADQLVGYQVIQKY
ncbi:hypothetical protein COLO4_00860 [Corchorus olitorius]|uniref:Type 9 secretion system plug protein N-terminal domain-containing protein n=1 Tax=Corchorus olitorius TaxID=93759 RepID=A0A1R3L3A6_9ROSI|nr:hypothetical protein COLO4_00860 [Corchorus olitorius]